MGTIRELLLCCRSSRGAAMVEYALVLPVFILLVFGSIQYGLLLKTHLSIRNAASVAARYATLGDPSSPPTANAIIQVAKDSLPGAFDPNDLTGSVDFSYSLPVSGETATRVELTYNYDLILPFVVPGQSGGSFNLKAEAVMR